MSGLFITFEGIEGCGKSTQVAQLQQRLEAAGRTAVVTREPGGTAVSEAIRAIVLNPEHRELRPITELLLYAAARAQHVDEFIHPALESGAIVLCDRFADSTTAYQGAGRSLNSDLIWRMHQVATRGTWPDLTVLLDLPAEAGLERARQTGAFDRIEAEPLAFHRAVREEFLRIASQDAKRVQVVDATQPVEAVAAAVWRLVEARLP